MAIIKCKFCSQNHETIYCQSYLTALKNNNLYALRLKNKLEKHKGSKNCSYCANTEHWSPKCPKKFNDIKQRLIIEKNIAEPAMDWLSEIGFGPGCMITGMSRERGYRAMEKSDKVILINDFRNTNHLIVFLQRLIYGKIRNWYCVDGISTAMEKVKQIYLPYHPIYAPMPTSKRVQIIHKALPEEIEKMKNALTCYKSNVMQFSTPEEFFNAGFDLKIKEK